VQSTERRAEVPIALLYAAHGLQPYLKDALAELGARVVYDAAAAQFDRSALDASGARVVLVNLEADADADLDALDDLLADDALTVVFNDADVSNRLQGWDQARWARHLAAKIRGAGELNPPRPPGAEAVPVRLKPRAAEPIGDQAPDLRFEIEGGELARALAADTGESLQRTRAALVTAEEPIAPQLVDPHARDAARHDAPTVVLPRVDVDAALRAAAAPASRHDAPTVELRGDAVRAAAAAAAIAPVAPAIDATADVGDEFGLGEFALDAAAGEAAGAAVADGIEELALEGADDFVAGPAPGAGAAALDLDPEFIASLRDFGLAGDAPLAQDAGDEPQGEATLDLTDEFDEALGALALAPLEDDDAPSQRESPPAGLDDLLLDLPDRETEAPAPPPAPAKTAPAAAPTPASKPKAPSFGTLSLADDDAAPAPAPPPAAAAEPAKKRSLDEFDLSGLSLAPLAEEEAAARTPVTGRAKFEIDEKDRASATLPPPVDAAPEGVDDDGAIAPDFELRGLREPQTDPDLAAELAAMAAAADALPLGQPVVHGVRNVWVLGASIGGPEAVREFLAAVPASVPAVFLLAQHMGADFLDLMVQQLARATTLPVRTVVDGDIARHGEVVVVPLAERLQIDAAGRIGLSPAGDNSPYSPSIDRVMRDVADRFGGSAGAIVFSGMAHDAIEGATYMRERGGTIWVQDPATCVISSMVDGAQDAGVVSFVGSPAELAQELIAEMARRAAS
jgi:chemotaxis response regulator CheB